MFDASRAALLVSFIPSAQIAVASKDWYQRQELPSLKRLAAEEAERDARLRNRIQIRAEAKLLKMKEDLRIIEAASQ